MATHIFVKCRSQSIPADRGQRKSTMLNLICQHQWQQNYDKLQDRVRSSGAAQSEKGFLHDYPDSIEHET